MDLIFNIESSHCYNDIHAFFSGVSSLLKDDGTFAFVDWRLVSDMEQLEKDLKTHFDIIHHENIAPNVIEALKQTTDLKKERIAKHVPKLLVGIFSDFSGVENSRVYRRLTSG